MKIVNILPDSHTIPCVPSTPIHPDNLAQALETFIDSVEVYATRAKQGRDKLLDLEWAIRSGRIAAEDAARERNRDIGHKVTVVVKKRGEEFTESDSLSFHPDIMNALKVQSDLQLLRAPIIAQSDALVLPLINAGYPDAAEAVELLGSKAKDSVFETHDLGLSMNRLRETGVCEGDLITPVWTNYRATLRMTLRQLQATPTQEADGAAPVVEKSKAKKKGGRPTHPPELKESVKEIWKNSGCRTYRECVENNLERLPYALKRCPFPDRDGEWKRPHEHDLMIQHVTEYFTRVMDTVNVRKRK